MTRIFYCLSVILVLVLSSCGLKNQKTASINGLPFCDTIMPLEERFYNYGYATSKVELYGFTEDTILFNNFIELVGEIDVVFGGDYYGGMPYTYCISFKDSSVDKKVELTSIITIQ